MKNPRLPFAYSVYFVVKHLGWTLLFMLLLVPGLMLMAVGILAGLAHCRWLNEYCQDGLDDLRNIFA